MVDPEGPKPVPTKEFSAPEKSEILFAELKSLIVRRFDDVQADLSEFRAEVDGRIDELKNGVDELFNWKGDVEQRLKNNSHRAQATSSADIEHDTKIAAGAERTEKLEKAIHETRALAESARDELEAQSKFMGVGKRGLKYVVSKEGRQDLTHAAIVLYAILKTVGVIK